jgi:hypothetical protein
MSVLTLAAAKQHLNITTAESDAELQDTIDDAEALIAKKCGPLTATVTTSRVRGYSGQLRLPITPVISLTSVTPVQGSVLDLSGVVVSASGVVEFTYSGWFGYGLYDVVYTAGRTSVPDDLLRGVKEMVRPLWSTQRPGDGGRFASSTQVQAANTIPGSAFLFPYRVEQAIADYMQAGV